MPKVIEAWGKAIEERQKYSPLVGAWYAEVGNLNRWFHMWAYESFEHRLKVREETRSKGVWPPAWWRDPAAAREQVLAASRVFAPAITSCRVWYGCRGSAVLADGHRGIHSRLPQVQCSVCSAASM